MLKTPLYNTHISLNAKIAPFGGWLMPIQYEGILAEHAHTRKAVSVFDICHMGEFMLEADPALSGFDRIVTQNIISMPEGSCRYGFMLDEQAGVLDDLVVYRINKTNWMLVVNAATTLGDYAHLKKNLTGEYNLKDISDKTGKLDVQGSESLDVLKDIFGDGLAKLNYYTFSEFTFHDQRCIVSRTGYTGELGYEIYISADYVVKLWKVLLKDVRVKPAGLGSRDTLRLEMGYPLYGQDLDINHTPLAAGLAKFVDLSKDFIGKDALLKEQAGGPKERLICFQADSRRAPRHGFAIFDRNQRVGLVTSGSFSPSLSVGIGMGYVAGNYSIGAQLIVKDAGTEIPVVVTKKPFYRCRTN
ncbi:MAG: glycine cleavage system aminomethyltransferase GcvT [Candidatus Omnitrophica bacterium]|nr:glycine cleavage system aminomethyltransferase GcvT [Candidatus Omnitrophota bacterium]